jgi:hypothetical protein
MMEGRRCAHALLLRPAVETPLSHRESAIADLGHRHVRGERRCSCTGTSSCSCLLANAATAFKTRSPRARAISARPFYPTTDETRAISSASCRATTTGLSSPTIGTSWALRGIDGRQGLLKPKRGTARLGRLLPEQGARLRRHQPPAGVRAGRRPPGPFALFAARTSAASPPPPRRGRACAPPTPSSQRGVPSARDGAIHGSRSCGWSRPSSSSKSITSSAKPRTKLAETIEALNLRHAGSRSQRQVIVEIADGR